MVSDYWLFLAAVPHIVNENSFFSPYTEIGIMFILINVITLISSVLMLFKSVRCCC